MKGTAHFMEPVQSVRKNPDKPYSKQAITDLFSQPPTPRARLPHGGAKMEKRQSARSVSTCPVYWMVVTNQVVFAEGNRSNLSLQSATNRRPTRVCALLPCVLFLWCNRVCIDQWIQTVPKCPQCNEMFDVVRRK